MTRRLAVATSHRAPDDAVIDQEERGAAGELTIRDWLHARVLASAGLGPLPRSSAGLSLAERRKGARS